MESNAQMMAKPRLNPMELKKQRQDKKQKISDETEFSKPILWTQKDASTEQVAEPSLEPSANLGSNRTIPAKIEDKLAHLYSRPNISKSQFKPQANIKLPVEFKIGHANIPFDGTLKSKLIVTTSFKYPGVIGALKKSNAIQDLTYLPQQNSKHSNSSIDPSTLWFQSLHRYVHPATTVPLSALTNELNSSMPSAYDEDFTSERLYEWQNAFCSAYHAFRQNRENEKFFVVASQFQACFYRQVEQNDLIIPELFNINKSNPKEHDLHEVYAIISHSTNKMRSELYQAGVKFMMPFNIELSQQEFEQHLKFMKELNAFAKNTPEASRIATVKNISHKMFGLDSLIAFSGHDAVHGAFDYILNYSGSQDVPSIYARFPFAYASLKPIASKSIGKVFAGNQQQSQEFYKTEVTGVLSPIDIQCMVKSLELRANEERSLCHDKEVSFSMLMETMTQSSRLNAAVLPLILQEQMTTEETKFAIDSIKGAVSSISWNLNDGYTIIVS